MRKEEVVRRENVSPSFVNWEWREASSFPFCTGGKRKGKGKGNCLALQQGEAE